ncbi:methionine ABC transporter ATP-binding protein [Micrococcales bacterium 31B]|nr:methionine ABC transporter ATP-binding protein [Micrococcales bacterium 31B]
MAGDQVAAGSPIIRFVKASKTFTGGKSSVHAVREVTLDINAGEVVGVIGYSGAGKSTLLRLINGLETPTAGDVSVLGQQVSQLGERGLRALRRDIGMIFQQFNLFNARTVAGNVGYPLKLAGVPRAEREARVTELLDFVGIGDKARRYPRQLSGGQKQRVGIARALASNPKILLADEATSALDPETTHEVLELLRRVNQQFGTTIVVITHEMDVVRRLCDRVAVMENGALLEYGPVYDVFAQPRAQATRRFVQGVLHDLPTPETLNRLRARHPGTLVSVAIREEPGGEAPSVNAIVQRHAGVRSSVVYGGITEIDARAFGSLVYEFAGEAAAVDALVAELAAAAPVITDLDAASHAAARPAAGEKEQDR